MALDNRTIKEIEDLIINQLEATFNPKIPLLSKAYNRVLAKVLAGVWQINYKLGSWIFLQLFVTSASFKSFTVFGKTIIPLIEWGRLIGVGDPDPATQARLSIDVTVNSPGEPLPSGTQFVSSVNGVVYITDQNYILTAGPVDTIEVIATVAGIGTVGNLNPDDPISLVNPLGVIDRDATVNSVLITAVDAQTEDSYRTEVIDRFKQRPQGGAFVDYRIWASEVEGVLQTYWYTGNIPTYVIGYVAGVPETFPDRVPTSNLLIAVGEAVTFSDVEGTPVADRKPVGAIVDPAGDKSYTNIKPITNKEFDIDIIGLDVEDPSTVKQLISDALNVYYNEREAFIEGLSFPPINNTVQQSAIIAIIQTVVAANGGTFLNAILSTGGVNVPNFVLEEGQLAKLDSLLYNGV